MPHPLALALPDSFSDVALVPEAERAELENELEAVAAEVLAAKRAQMPWADALRNPAFPNLRQFHQSLRDALFLEIPEEIRGWVDALAQSGGRPPGESVSRQLVELARSEAEAVELQRALAELLLFESVRLRLLIETWQNEEFETLGGEESDIDEIAWAEVETILQQPDLVAPGVRPMQVMFASAHVMLAREAAERALALQISSEDLRETLRMRARLRKALRELRLPEAVLLENAMSNLLDQDRLELAELQSERPLALSGLSRQAMDQRVSRGRRALAATRSSWPKRRKPALIDLFRAGSDE